MDPARFTRVDAMTWRIEPSAVMRVPSIIYADEDLIRGMDEYDLAQERKRKRFLSLREEAESGIWSAPCTLSAEELAKMDAWARSDRSR
jgi:hypothetical protein